MKMNWTDMLAALVGEKEGAPDVRIYRKNCRPNSYATPHGNGTYDPGGGLLLAMTDRYPDAIYADGPFLTCVSCGVALPEAHTLSMKPDQMAGLRSFFKKTTQYRVRWSVKTDLREETQARILDFLSGQNQECLKHVAIQLLPAEEGACNHRLIVTTKLLPDDLTNFCLVKDFDPFQQEEKRTSDFEAACFLVKTMIGCCRGVALCLSKKIEFSLGARKRLTEFRPPQRTE